MVSCGSSVRAGRLHRYGVRRAEARGWVDVGVTETRDDGVAGPGDGPDRRAVGRGGDDAATAERPGTRRARRRRARPPGSSRRRLVPGGERRRRAPRTAPRLGSGSGPVVAAQSDRHDVERRRWRPAPRPPSRRGGGVARAQATAAMTTPPPLTSPGADSVPGGRGMAVVPGEAMQAARPGSGTGTSRRRRPRGRCPCSSVQTAVTASASTAPAQYDAVAVRSLRPETSPRRHRPGAPRRRRRRRRPCSASRAGRRPWLRRRARPPSRRGPRAARGPP